MMAPPGNSAFGNRRAAAFRERRLVGGDARARALDAAERGKMQAALARPGRAAFVRTTDTRTAD